MSIYETKDLYDSSLPLKRVAQVPLNILLIPPSLYNPLTTSIGPEYLGGPVAACCTYDGISSVRNSLLVKRIGTIIFDFKMIRNQM